MNNLELSVIIVNYNGRDYVERCVDSILRSNANNFEIIVVDNGSSDGSVESLKSKYARSSDKIVFLELEKNYGPARARNEGTKLAKGEFLCFLDNDTEVEKNWSQAAISEFKKEEGLGIIQCKLLLAKERNRIDYVGEYLGQNGFLVQRAMAGKIDQGQYDQEAQILAAKSAGMFIRKKAFNEAGGFDEDYFIYLEETDLGWRTWLAGYTVKFVFQSRVYHEFGTSTVILGKSQSSHNAKFHGCKNYVATLIKNLGFWNLIKILPLHVLLWLGLAWFSLLKGRPKVFLWIHKAIGWNILNLTRTLAKRRVIQNRRTLTDRELFKIILRKKPLSYFFKKAVVKQKIGQARSFND